MLTSASRSQKGFASSGGRSLSTRFTWLLLLLCLEFATGNCAAIEIFVTINGIPGSSTVAGYPGAIAATSMSHGVGRTISINRGSVTSSPASQSEVVFTKSMDASTPLLYDAATHGGPIDSVEIDFVQTSPTNTLFYKITLNQAYVSSMSTSASAGSTPSDSFTLFYEKISWSYIQVDRTYTGSWDRISNTGTNNSILTDSDADGLPDVWEMEYFGTLSYGANDDPDHDGLNNYQEYIAGTNPNDANSLLRVTEINLANGQASLTWNSVAGKTYTIYSANQVDGPYAPVLTLPSAGDGQTSTNLAGSASNQFYRVGVQ
jgi:type VI secretion system Hcp family effector